VSDSPTTGARDGELGPLAWAALVARWVEVARASRAIPPEFAQLRDSIPHLIAIEATTAALGELASVPEVDRPHARAVAEVTIRRAAAELDRLWRGEEWPSEISDACEAAEQALQRAVYAGLDALVVTGDRALEVPEFDFGLDPGDPNSLRGTLAAMPPGSLAMPGEPICWWSGRGRPSFAATHDDRATADRLELVRNAAPVQVYRGLDERGRFTSDTLAPISAEVLPGLPMLVPILLDGTLIGRFLHPRDSWRSMHLAAMDGRDTISVG
jgi:hypothetical protein